MGNVSINGYDIEKVRPYPKKINCPCCGKELINLDDKKFNAWCDDCKIEITLDPDEETPVTIENDAIRVDWYNADEGVSGDYHPENLEDINLLRFDVYKAADGGWEEVEDASYCTMMPADSDWGVLIKSLYCIFKEYNNVLKADSEASVKKLGESLSWISPDDF